MLTTSRKTELLKRLDQFGQLQVTPLAQEFNVSEDTIRRDLRELASEGLLVRVHGGAVPASPTHRPLETRRSMFSEEKQDLAREGANRIKDGMIVSVDGGSTHAELCRFVPRERRCTIVTHSPPIAARFEFHEKIEVVLIGGRLFRHSMVAVGPETSLAFSRIRTDLCLLGVTGIHPELGLSTGDADEAAIKRVMAEAAGETIVLATPDKVGRASPWGIVPLEDLSELVGIGPRPHWLLPPLAYTAARR